MMRQTEIVHMGEPVTQSEQGGYQDSYQIAYDSVVQTIDRVSCLR
jgi:hypothetical protein